MTYEVVIGALSLALVAVIGACVKFRESQARDKIALQKAQSEANAAAAALENERKASGAALEDERHQMVFAEMQSLLETVSKRVESLESASAVLHQRVVDCETDRAAGKILIGELQKQVADVKAKVGL